MERRGKANYCLIENDGSVCALGAIAVANGYSMAQWPWPSMEEYTTPLVRFIGVENGIAKWSNNNDAPTVIAGLRAVAATLRAKESVPVIVERVTA